MKQNNTVVQSKKKKKKIFSHAKMLPEFVYLLPNSNEKNNTKWYSSSLQTFMASHILPGQTQEPFLNKSCLNSCIWSLCPISIFCLAGT